MTLRLYYTEPWRREFDATVTAVDTGGGYPRVRLDRTAFYPTTGGQPNDLGTLGAARVLDVVDEDDAGVVHVTDATLDVGAQVHGTIDWDRRADHMQQHTGQHVLSAAFVRTCDAVTVSFHLGSAESTIDLAREVTADQIARAEAAANQVVFDNRPVTIRFVSAEEAARLPLRKEPARGGPLRLIEIADYDLSACGGTHVSRTGEIGVVLVRATERFKGGTRVTFVCGWRAVASYHELLEAADGAARALTIHPRELPVAIPRLQEENKALRRDLKDRDERLSVHLGRELVARARPFRNAQIVVEAAEGDADALKRLARAAAESPTGAAILWSATSPAAIVAARGSAVTWMDCGAIVKQVCQRLGGRGGGRPDLAQGGGLAADPDGVRSVVEDVLRQAGA